jgi:hypothetical protein
VSALDAGDWVWTPRALAIAGLGIAGVLGLLGQAVWRLTPWAVEPLSSGQLSAPQAALYLAWVLASGYFEGYRAFQKGFCPRVVVRAAYLAQHPEPLHVLLAPAFCMSLIHATRRGLALAWGILAMVVFLVWIVHRMPQPWRGMVDGGVVVALAWGQIAILYFSARALAGRLVQVRTDLPEPANEPSRPTQAG